MTSTGLVIIGWECRDMLPFLPLTFKHYSIMKKLLLLFVIILFACQKEYKYCWLCNEKVVYSAPGYRTDTIKSEYEKCDYTNLEIRAYEKDKTFIGTQTLNGLTINIDSYVRCGRLICI